VDAPHRVLTAVEVVEQARFDEELRLGGVQIFRLAAVERASSESDQRAGVGVDRNDQAVSESIVVAALFFSRRDQADGLEPLLAVLLAEAAEDVVPGVGREAEAVFLDDLFGDAA